MFIGGLNWETTERKYRLNISAHNYLSLKLHKIYVYRLSYFRLLPKHLEAVLRGLRQ